MRQETEIALKFFVNVTISKIGFSDCSDLYRELLKEFEDSKGELTIDITNWDVSNVARMNLMFDGTALTTLPCWYEES